MLHILNLLYITGAVLLLDADEDGGLKLIEGILPPFSQSVHACTYLSARECFLLGSDDGMGRVVEPESRLILE